MSRATKPLNGSSCQGPELSRNLLGTGIMGTKELNSAINCQELGIDTRSAVVDDH